MDLFRNNSKDLIAHSSFIGSESEVMAMKENPKNRPSWYLIDDSYWDWEVPVFEDLMACCVVDIEKQYNDNPLHSRGLP